MARAYDKLYQQLLAQGGNWNVEGLDRADELAAMLYSRGVTDLTQLKNDGKGGLTFNGQAWQHVNREDQGGLHGKATGGMQGNQLAWSAAGHGAVGYKVVGFDKNGTPIIGPNWESSSDWGKARDVAKVAALAATGAGLAGVGPLSGLAGSFTMPSVATIGKSALINGALAEATGGKFIDGVKSGIISGGLSGFNPAAGLGLKGITGSVVNGAARAGIGAALNGGNIKNAIISGGVAAGVNGLNFAKQLGITDPNLAKAVNQTAARAASGVATGKNIDARQLLASGLLSYGKGVGNDAMKSFTGTTGDVDLEEGSFAPGGKYDATTGAAMTDEEWEAANAGSEEDWQNWDLAGDDPNDQPILDDEKLPPYDPQMPVQDPDTYVDIPEVDYDGKWLDQLLSKLGIGSGTNKNGKSTVRIGGVDFETSDILRILGGAAGGAWQTKVAEENRKWQTAEKQKDRDWQDSRRKADWEREERLAAEKRARMGSLPTNMGLLGSAVTITPGARG